MKKIKSDAKGKILADPPKLAESGPKLQSQSSTTVTSVPYPEKIKTPEMNNKQRSKDRIFTLCRLLNAKLIKKIPFHQPDQPPRNVNLRVWCEYHIQCSRSSYKWMSGIEKQDSRSH